MLVPFSDGFIIGIDLIESMPCPAYNTTENNRAVKRRSLDSADNNTDADYNFNALKLAATSIPPTCVCQIMSEISNYCSDFHTVPIKAELEIKRSSLSSRMWPTKNY